MIDTPDGLWFVQLASRKAALGLELKGMARHGRTAYSICKSEYGLKGTRQQVFAQMQKLVEDAIQRHQAHG